MTREEALEVVRKNLPHLGIGATEMTDALGTLIPELAESEDEKIRKELIEYHKQQFENNRDQEVGLFHKDAIAWLEKQEIFSKNGEGCYYYHADGSYTFIGTGGFGPIEDIKINGERPKTENNSLDLPGACCVEKQKEPHKRLRDKTPWIVTAKEELAHAKERLQANLEELHRIRAEKEKQKENPKSSDSIPSDCTSDAKCEDRDSNYGVFPEDVIVVARACEKLKAHGYTELAHALKNVNLYTKEQKPVDYDHEMWKNCEANFEGGKKEVIEHPEKYGLTKQKPASISCGHENDAEWGQEDKEKIVTISEIIEHCTTIPYSGGTLTLNKEYKKELLCFIRTLRPSWKPSKEQMVALNALNCHGDLSYIGQQNQLISLYNDLKKLM